MTTAVLSNGTSFIIPPSDLDFFKVLAKKMGWKAIDHKEKLNSNESWVSPFAGKWVDERSTEEIIKEIHDSRTTNKELSL